jgi:plasmid stabilization system protein ParE
MIYRVKITPTALADAEGFYLWIGEYSKENATKWFNGLFNVVETLTSMPQRCPITPERELVGQDIRCLFYRKNYRILYTVEGEAVTIYHIRHTSQSVMTREEFLREPYREEILPE